ncbi:Hypothetical predicted protein [Olea europaea subsp. europaea]|uniref:Uncharacterized protein n=1 Tax=Olea europaea subsp. europaea TaxID=158383 RepID=A0A8S0TG44_OLEEU|nr:Hypothetical predicted protein [Olea europaea subsp. europaea]
MRWASHFHFYSAALVSAYPGADRRHAEQNAIRYKNAAPGASRPAYITIPPVPTSKSLTRESHTVETFQSPARLFWCALHAKANISSPIGLDCRLRNWVLLYSQLPFSAGSIREDTTPTPTPLLFILAYAIDSGKIQGLFEAPQLPRRPPSACR